jgi:hypothetical protein
VKALMKDYFASEDVVGDNSEPGLQLLDALERILAHGLKGNASQMISLSISFYLIEEFNGAAVSYWDFLNQFSRLGDDGVDGKFLCSEVLCHYLFWDEG